MTQAFSIVPGTNVVPFTQLGPKMPGWHICHVRLKTSMLRTNNVTFFYHDDTTVMDFNKAVNEFGHVKTIDFEDETMPVYQDDWIRAHREGRVVGPFPSFIARS